MKGNKRKGEVFFMFRKKAIILLAIFVICFTINPTFALANQGNVKTVESDLIQPMWNYIFSYRNAFDISKSGRADVTVILNSFTADSIRVEASIQQFKDGRWVTIKTWSNTVKDNITCGLAKSWYVMSGYYYRMVSTGMVYKNGKIVEQTSYTSPIRLY